MKGGAVMINIAVCDDVQEQTEAILTLLDRYRKERPGTRLVVCDFNSEQALLESIETEGNYDIYLLDIIMQEIGGIELARNIREHDENAALIFLTNSTDFALEAYNLSADQYIIKPVGKDALYPVLDKIIKARKQEKDKFILVPASGGIMAKVPYSSIVVIERVGRVMCYHLESGNRIESRTIRCPFEEAVAHMLEDNRFLQVHQSFVVNLAHVQELRAGSFFMENEMDVSIPKPRYTAVKNTYFEYLCETGH